MYNIVMIRWEDAAADARWCDEPDLAPTECISVGVLIFTDPYHLIADSYNNLGQWSGLTAIPSPWVKEIIFLKQIEAGKQIKADGC